jgi:hypothetical protein
MGSSAGEKKKAVVLFVLHTHLCLNNVQIWFFSFFLLSRLVIGELH